MFETDGDVNVGEVVRDVPGYDLYFSLAVSDHEKAMALDKIVKHEVKFGDTVLGVGVEDVSPEAEAAPDVEVFKKAFKDNHIVKDFQTVADITGTGHSFIRFWPEVIQFYDDDMTDYNGNWNGLAEDIAREIFDNRRWDIQFCTADKREN